MSSQHRAAISDSGNFRTVENALAFASRLQ